MKINKIKKGLILVSIASGTLAIGCELIVDFDRTKIPTEILEASVADGTTNPPTEAGADAAGDQQAPKSDASDSGTVADADAAADADADQ